MERCLCPRRYAGPKEWTLTYDLQRNADDRPHRPSSAAPPEKSSESVSASSNRTRPRPRSALGTPGHVVPAGRAREDIELGRAWVEVRVRQLPCIPQAKHPYHMGALSRHMRRNLRRPMRRRGARELAWSLMLPHE